MDLIHTTDILENFPTALFTLILLSLLYVLFAPSERSAVARLNGPSLFDYVLPWRPANMLYRISGALHFTKTIDEICNRYGDARGVCSARVGFQYTVLTTNPDDVAQLLADRKMFNLAWNIYEPVGRFSSNHMLLLSEAQHRPLRKFIHERFNATDLSFYHNSISNAAGRLINDLLHAAHKTDVVNISAMLLFSAFDVISNAAFQFNLPKERLRAFQADFNACLTLTMRDIMIYPLGKMFESLGSRDAVCRKTAVLKTFMGNLIEQRKLKRSEDRRSRAGDGINEKSSSCDESGSDKMNLLDHLMEYYKDDAKTLSTQAAFFFSAGAFTTAQSVSWMIYYLCTRPAMQARLLEEVDALARGKRDDEYFTLDELSGMTYAAALWKETMRLSNPARVMLRVALEDVTLKGSGLALKKGTPVFANAMRPMRDPTHWGSDAEEFKPDRWIDATSNTVRKPKGVPPTAYMPFGVGPRACLGSFFATHEGILLLAELYRRFTFKLACRADQVESVTRFVDSISFKNDRGEYEDCLPVYFFQRH